MTVFDGEYRKDGEGLKKVLQRFDPLAVASQ